MIAQHHRDNHERSGELTGHIKRLINAAYTVGESIRTSPAQIEQADTLFVLLAIAEEKLEQLEKAQLMEWAGLGGRSDNLTGAELKTARGE